MPNFLEDIAGLAQFHQKTHHAELLGLSDGDELDSMARYCSGLSLFLSPTDYHAVKNAVKDSECHYVNLRNNYILFPRW